MKPVKFGLSCLFFTSETPRVDGNAFDRRIANGSYLLAHMTHRISVMTQNVVEFQRLTVNFEGAMQLLDERFQAS